MTTKASAISGASPTAAAPSVPASVAKDEDDLLQGHEYETVADDDSIDEDEHDPPPRRQSQRRDGLDDDDSPTGGCIAVVPHWNDSVDRSGVAELCQYVQTLEAEKRDLFEQVHFLREQDASQRIQISALQTRIETLQRSLQSANESSDACRQERDATIALQRAERERTAALVVQLDDLHSKYEDAERARQLAVFKFSELQAAMAEASTQRIMAVAAPTAPMATSVSRDRGETEHELIERHRRELELVRQKAQLESEQLAEKHKLALDMALRMAEMEHSTALEKVKLECELRLSEWRHEETARAKEIEAAMEEDRYSIRVEAKQAMQRAQIDQRVSHLQAQAALAATHHQQSDSAFSFGTLDEVLVRMQMELVRTRRFEGLKKVLLIRMAKVDQAQRHAFYHWKLEAMHQRVFQLHAVLHMHRIVTSLELRKKRSVLLKWRAHSTLRYLHAYHNRALGCWNRMIAVERISKVLEMMVLKRTLGYFHQWRRNVTPGGGSSEELVPLKLEIKKLHEQLGASKSEAWRYKRQLLKQFL
ncbi:TPA: hypothetical protein N0F65_012204 [Lagenidium giganteum]|uniref:Pericentrin/AKAP-450 centrosomal targeting domain-containing protein n=1 Tax=Lagenidium giganteum TaxID=4803 RepID=A0AAV2ZEI2_9STRA|nr:TPA: hypothetical protein N0F65_012204 [Lagenidium giganteum]